jgi:hypothetical protein
VPTVGSHGVVKHSGGAAAEVVGSDVSQTCFLRSCPHEVVVGGY